MSEISELFSRDPLQLTREDRAEIITKLRDNRQSFMMGQKTAKLTAPKAPKSTGEKITGLSLGDLDL